MEASHAEVRSVSAGSWVACMWCPSRERPFLAVSAELFTIRSTGQSLGADVKLQSATSAFSLPAQTDQNGEFTFNPVAVGDYIVTVSGPGFASAKQNITVIAESSPVLHFPLDIAPVSENVTVSGQAEVTNIDSSTPTTLVDRQDIARTPGADRTNSLQMITDYVPGSYVTHDQLHVRGGHQVSWLIDGVPIPNTNIASNVGPQIDPKDIDYLEAQRGSYDAGIW